MTQFIFLSEKHKKIYLDFYHNKNKKYAKLIKYCKTIEELDFLSKNINYKKWLKTSGNKQSGGLLMPAYPIGTVFAIPGCLYNPIGVPPCQPLPYVPFGPKVPGINFPIP